MNEEGERGVVYASESLLTEYIINAVTLATTKKRATVGKIITNPLFL